MSDTARNESIDNEKKEHQQEQGIHSELSPGAQLSAQRQALNWSVEEVASQLNLAPRQIHAIESDNYAALPGMASARGFIRAYAKLLKVEAAPLLEAVAKEATAVEQAVPLRRELPTIRLAENRLSPPGSPRLLPRAAAAIFLLVVLLSAGVFIMQQMGMQSMLPKYLHFGTADVPGVLTLLDSANAPARDTPAPVTSATNADPDAEKRDVDTAIKSVEGDKAEKHDVAPGEADANSVALAAVAQPVAVENVAVQPLVPPGAETKNILIFKLREDSWIEIRRSDDSTMVAALLKAGTTESFKITGPVAVTVGNAAGVDATLRGKPITLKPATKSNVARLTLK